MIIKVVQRYKEDLTSCFMYHKELSIRYVPNEWASAPIGGLFCFDNAYDAKVFAGQCDTFEAWWCDAVGVFQPPQLIPWPHTKATSALVSFWKNAPGNSLAHIKSPHGTVMAKRVKLIKPVSFK